MSGKLIPSGLAYLADNIAAKQNILGVSKEQSAAWAKDLALPKRSETVFFAGCGYQFSRQLEILMSLTRQMDKSALGAELPMRFARFQKKLGLDLPGIYSKTLIKGGNNEAQPLRAALKVLQNLGIQPGYLADDEPCCGAPLYHAGLHKEFARNARQAYQKLKSFGVKRVISIVPSCTHAILARFPLYVDGFDLEVKHFPRSVKVTYHDPCQLARYLGLIDEPRQILESIRGIELVETAWTKREWATCCGGGGGFEAVFPELSQILAVNRVSELLETGAEIIVTHCPGCAMQLKDGLKELKADSVEVLDLAEVIAMAMEA
jgi:heterodisulfide reductase subunit B